jgi:hypothetical protein
MGFFSSASQVSRFVLHGLDVTEFKERLTAFSFQDIEESAEELSVGWTSIDDMDDVAFALSPIQKGTLYTWALRIDTRKVKPAVLSRLTRKRIAEEADREGKAVPKDRRQEIKEQTKLHLLMKTQPEARTIDVLYAPQEEMLYFFSNNKFAVETFTELFEQTFGMELERLTPAWLAKRLAGQKRAEEVFEGVIDAYDAPMPTAVPSLFLAYLLRKAVDGESINGVHLESGGKVALEKLVGDGLEKCTVSGWQGDPMDELLIAMADAKRISTANLILNDENTQESWTVSVSANFEMNVKTPKVDVQDKEDLDGVFLEKFFLVERFFQMWDDLYKDFLAAWTPALENEMVAWAKQLAPGTMGKDKHAGTVSDARAG